MSFGEDINEWDLATTNLSRVRGQLYEVAVLGVGSMEPHNLHLPYGEDFFQADAVSRESCAKAWAKCPSILRLPTMPFSVDCNLMGFPMTVSVSQATVNAFIGELFTSMRRHGLRKFVLINGHGGNSFTSFVRQFQHDLDVHVFLIDWWEVCRDCYDQIFTRPDEHAGQCETSLALELVPGLVELHKAVAPKVKTFRFEAMRRGWVSTIRDFARMTDCCSLSNPQGANKEAGRRYLDVATDRIGSFLAELASTPIDEDFPFAPIQEK